MKGHRNNIFLIFYRDNFLVSGNTDSTVKILKKLDELREISHDINEVYKFLFKKKILKKNVKLFCGDNKMQIIGKKYSEKKSILLWLM